jgi:hypothetical protein
MRQKNRRATTHLGRLPQIAQMPGAAERPVSALCDNGPMDRPGRFYAIPAQQRDAMILELRRRGWTYERIGKRVGMTESGVRRALERIRVGGFGEGMRRD